MLRTPAILAMALKHLKGEFFTLPEVGGTKVQALIFTVIADHVKDHTTAPDMAMLHVYIESALNGLIQDEAAKEEYLNGLNAFETFAAKVDDRSIKLCQDMIQQLADTCVFEPAAMALISNGAMSTPVDQLDDLICKLQEVSSQRRSTNASDVVNNVMTTKIEDGQRELSGVSWFDARCGEGRGPVLGTVMGLLAPQGAGKSTSGFEFCISKALLGKPALLALAEEGLSRNVLNKIVARTTGISANEISKVDVSDFNNVIELGKHHGMDIDMLKMKHDMVQKNLHVLDLVANEGGMEEVESTIDSMAMADKKPHTIYIDWAGIMAERIMSVGLRGREFTDIFDALKALSFAAENLAERHNTFTVFSHQLGSVAAAKGVGYNTTVYDAADCKTWSAPFMYVLTISGMHPKTLLQRARLVKARYEPAGQEAVLKMHGALARFEDMSDKFELRGKNFVSKTPKDSKAMPKEKT